MYILTVQLDALVVGLHENDDISSKIDHFGFPLPVLLHCIPCQLDILKKLSPQRINDLPDNILHKLILKATEK